MFKVSSVVRVHGLQSHRGSHTEDQRLVRLHQVCAQHQGQICVINLVIQRFKSASRRIQRAFMPPPSRRGTEDQDSGHSDVQMQIQENHVLQNVSPTSRWWTFIAFIMSVMHFMVRGYQLSIAMFKKVKQFTVMLVNVNQVSTIIIAIINQRRRQVQRKSQSRQSGQTRQSRLQYLCTFILFSALSATCILIVFRFMSFYPSSYQSSCLTAVSNSVESHHSQVLHLSSASVVTFTSRMAAAPQPVNEAAAQVARSILVVFIFCDRPVSKNHCCPNNVRSNVACAICCVFFHAQFRVALWIFSWGFFPTSCLALTSWQTSLGEKNR